MNSKRSSTLTFQKIKEHPRKSNTIPQKAEEEIKHNLSLLEATLESTADGILVVDREGNITKYNKKFIQMWGIPEPILASRSDDQAIDFVLGQLKSPHSFLARVRELYASPEAEDFDVLEFSDGRVFERYSQPQRIGDQIVGRVWSFRDVTKRIQIEQSLIKREEEAKRLSMENSILAEIGQIITSTLDINDIYNQFAGIVRKILPFDRISIPIVNPDRTSITIAYAFGVEIEGRPTGSVLPMKEPVYEEVVNRRKSFLVQTEDENWMAVHHPNYLNNFRSGIRSIMAIPLVSKNQVIGILNLQSCKPNAYTDADVKLAERIGNQIAGAIANAQLYAEQKKTEMALRESENRYRDLVEFSEYLISSHDLEGNILSVNQRAANLLGYEPGDLIGRNIRDQLAPEVKHKFDQYLETILKEGKARGMMLILTASGEKRLWEYNNSLRIEGGIAQLVRSMAHDITDLKRMEKERERLILDLKNALSQVKQLSGLLPICASCKKIRDDKGYWNQIEIYIRDHAEVEFSHGLCPDCLKKLYPDIKI